VFNGRVSLTQLNLKTMYKARDNSHNFLTITEKATT